MDVSRITRNEHGEPTVTITLTGYHEVYRFAHHMESGQVEFGLAGNGIIRRLRRRFTKRQWDEWMATLHGAQGRRIAPCSTRTLGGTDGR
jgi:hypothetical protein